MSLQRINPDDIETFTLETNPPRTFISSSTQGVTGVLNVFARQSDRMKEVQPLSLFSQSFFNDKDLNSDIQAILQSTSSNVFNLVKTYMTDVNNQTPSSRLKQTVEILRFTPPVQFDSDTLRKGIVINSLMKYYRPTYPEAHFAFSNYHSLNFFTASTFPSGNVMMYPMVSSSYAITDGFTFDFWINPKYTTDFRDSSASFKAGTIMHVSSSYAISLVSGSSKDINGYPNAYRIMLQLSSSADSPPSTATTASALTFLCDDNALQRNRWHHVSIRWGSNINQSSGSFVIDGYSRGSFVVSGSSVGTGSFPGSGEPVILFVGNFYEGTNTGLDTQALFISTNIAQRDGLVELVNDPQEDPDNFFFRHPLNAEVHDLKLYNRYLYDHEIGYLRHDGPTGSLLATTGSGGNLLFYLPPFFTRESPTRKFVGDHGGLLITPFQERDGSTSHPFSLDLSFGIAGHYINLENFVRDFATGNYPRLFGLTASAITGQAQTALTANQYFYATGSNIARSLMILPNDNGQFFPNFNVMSQSNLNLSTFIDDNSTYTPGFITLRDMLPTRSIAMGLVQDSGSMMTNVLGPSPEDLTISGAQGLTVFHRTKDNTSNQVVFFDISNLYYGKQIHPTSFSVVDTAMSNSDGKVRITLADDGEGNLYRADCLTTQSNWNSVGNLFYNEGIGVVKHPSLYFFGKDQFTMNFKGVQDIHVLTFNCFKRPLQVVSSSNPDFLLVSASDNANDTDQRFVYITGINLHDEDLNVIVKSNFAQPVLARTADKFLFKVKVDF